MDKALIYILYTTRNFYFIFQFLYWNLESEIDIDDIKSISVSTKINVGRWYRHSCRINLSYSFLESSERIRQHVTRGNIGELSQQRVIQETLIAHLAFGYTQATLSEKRYKKKKYSNSSQE